MRPQPGKTHISTHTPLAGRDLTEDIFKVDLKISTHTPLAGRDAPEGVTRKSSLISTHTPLAGRDAHMIANG